MSEESLRRQLYESYKNRAVLYYLIFDELRKQFGPAAAEAALSRAVYRRGTMIGEAKYAEFGPDDLAGLKEAFLGGIPDGGRMFQPEVVGEDSEQLDIKFHACPLRDAWLELGLPGADVETLCRIAARIDNGTFESAGFSFSADTWRAGGEGCCFLHIRRGG